MSAIDSRVRTWLVWAMPFAVIALLIGWETDWGRALTRVPAPDADVVPQPVKLRSAPRVPGRRRRRRRPETVERTLFNPTRRPAPPTIAAAAKSSMQKGQFVLTGTTVVDQKATAFLREVNGGRSRRVEQGETVNGMLVAEVRSDRVKLKLNDDAEELVLKTAAGPRTTVQPVPAAGQPGQPGPGQPGAPVPPAAPVQPVAGSQGAPAQGQAVTDVLANRRRAARAAEAAANTATQTPPAAAAGAPGAAAPARSDPAWNEVYQRYMQPRR